MDALRRTRDSGLTTLLISPDREMAAALSATLDESRAFQILSDLKEYPSPNALYFVWEGNDWKQIQHEDFPGGSVWNLEMGIAAAPGHEKDDLHGLVTQQFKESRLSSLRSEQKRLGWRRVNESLNRREGCLKWGSPTAKEKAGAEIFIKDGKSICYP